MILVIFRWRRMRRVAHETFNVHASERFRPMQEREAALLVANILQEPKRWSYYCKRYDSTSLCYLIRLPIFIIRHSNAASVALTSVFLRPLTDSSTDHIINRMDEISRSLTEASIIGTYLVDVFPIMLYLPEWLARWKREGREHHEAYTAMFERLMSDLRQKLVRNCYHSSYRRSCKPSLQQSGQFEDCLGASSLEAEDRGDLSKKESAWLAGVML